MLTSYFMGQETVFSSRETSCCYRFFPALYWDETKSFQSLCGTPKSHKQSKNNRVHVPASTVLSWEEWETGPTVCLLSASISTLRNSVKTDTFLQISF